jgi:hypothetical protein
MQPFVERTGRKGFSRCENRKQDSTWERAGQIMQMRNASRLATERAFQLPVAPLTTAGGSAEPDGMTVEFHHFWSPVGDKACMPAHRRA